MTLNSSKHWRFDAMNIKDLLPFGKKTVPTKQDDNNPYTLLRKDIDSLFDNFSRSFENIPFGGQHGSFMPKADVRENEKEIIVSVELPGMDEKDIDISLTKDALTIKGEKKETTEEKGENFYRLERSYGSFNRTIPFPVEVETRKTVAHFKKGVVTIVLPKSAKTVAETKKIPVRSE